MAIAGGVFVPLFVVLVLKTSLRLKAVRRIITKGVRNQQQKILFRWLRIRVKGTCHHARHSPTLYDMAGRRPAWPSPRYLLSPLKVVLPLVRPCWAVIVIYVIKKPGN